MQHIDVSSMLRQAVACDLYSNLVTRPTGAAVRAQIQALVGSVPDRTLTVIDFSHVRMIDFSCADEVVAKLLLPYLDGIEAGDAYFIFRGFTEDHWDAVEAVLERHGLALLVEERGGACPRGVMSREAQRAWEAVRDLGAARVEDVAARLEVSAERAAALLAGLHRQRLLMRADGAYLVVAARG